MANHTLDTHAVIIASMGRPQVLWDTLASLARQTAAPRAIILSVTAPDDLPQQGVPPGVTIVFSARGSSVQRNTGIDALPDEIDLISFLDDDVELEPDYLEVVNRFLNEHPTYVLADGFLVHDGDIGRAEALSKLDAPHAPARAFTDTTNAYGCNMTVRRAVADEVRFDERLKLYAWLEDADFTRRCLAYGRCANVAGARLVHLRASSGRVSGKRYGFAQITNAYYLKRKGQMSMTGLIRHHWAPAVLSNLWGAFKHSPTIDRTGRLLGNAIAFGRIATGRCEPEYVEAID